MPLNQPPRQIPQGARPKLLPLVAAALPLLGCLAVVGEADATVVEIEFSVGGERYGGAHIRLFDSAMPNSVANFLGYFDRYPDTFIHRNPRASDGGPDGDFVVQGGGFTYVPPSSAPGITTDAPIADEPGGGVQGISNLRGTLANAKSGPDTTTSQWFVNLSDNTFLDDPGRDDGGFGAFGRVVAGGMAVFDAIDLLEKANLDSGSLFDNVPVGDTDNPLDSLVTVSSIEVLNIPDGDYNFDGVVDAADYTVWRDDFGFNRRGEADGNGDGVVDELDLEVWRNTFGQSTLTSNSIPEPAALGLAALAGLAAVTRRRR